MLEFIKDNWANILLIIVGSFTLATYILQERKKKIDAASLIVLQIDEFQERLREISTFIVDGQLNETAFYICQNILCYLKGILLESLHKHLLFLNL